MLHLATIYDQSRTASKVCSADKKVGERSLCGFTLLYIVGPNREDLPPPPHPVTKHDANNAHGSFLYQRKERRAKGGDLAQVQTNDAYTVQEFTVVKSLPRLTASF